MLTERSSTMKHTHAISNNIYCLIIIKCHDWVVNSFRLMQICDVCLSDSLHVIGVFSVERVCIGKSGLRTCAMLCEIRENSWSSASEKIQRYWESHLDSSLRNASSRYMSAEKKTKTKPGPCWHELGSEARKTSYSGVASWDPTSDDRTSRIVC